ncbi:MAG: 50S ribosomal protein L18e [Candidatus Bathyarchaeota archaeon]|nr:50S ribosomal protein L18e [Candidatus Bathyarchaeota archaeon]
MRETKTTNPQLIELIALLRKESRENNAPIWLDVAECLSKTRSQRVAVNLSKINRHTEKSDVVVVPGKILAAGTLNHSITVAAFDVSTAAKAKLDDVKAKYVTIKELMTKNPKGSNIKIIR